MFIWYIPVLAWDDLGFIILLLHLTSKMLNPFSNAKIWSVNPSIMYLYVSWFVWTKILHWALLLVYHCTNVWHSNVLFILRGLIFCCMSIHVLQLGLMSTFLFSFSSNTFKIIPLFYCKHVVCYQRQIYNSCYLLANFQSLSVDVWFFVVRSWLSE